MKDIKNMILIFLFFSLIVSILNSEYTELDEINFGENAESKLKGTGIFKVVANYKTGESQKYLYIYPKNHESGLFINKAIYKIYFKEISDKETGANYLDSDYSTLDFNSGLLIKISTLKKNKANIFIITYGSAEIKIEYRYADDVSFPTKFYFTNLQLNQFTLEKGAIKTIKYDAQCGSNEYIMILCKTSLRNIEVSVKYKNEDYTEKLVTSLYPNGYSIFIQKIMSQVYS